MLQVKTYCSILKTFYNDKNFPLIPLPLTDKKFVFDIKTKANIFNKFFGEQCTPLKNESVLPSRQKFLTREKLCSLDFSNDKILRLLFCA